MNDKIKSLLKKWKLGLKGIVLMIEILTDLLDFSYIPILFIMIDLIEYFGLVYKKIQEKKLNGNDKPDQLS